MQTMPSNGAHVFDLRKQRYQDQALGNGFQGGRGSRDYLKTCDLEQSFSSSKIGGDTLLEKDPTALGHFKNVKVS